MCLVFCTGGAGGGGLGSHVGDLSLYWTEHPVGLKFLDPEHWNKAQWLNHPSDL